MDKKVVFVTGASRGIGKAVAEKFAAEGWAVAGFYRAAKVEDSENCKYYQMDVLDRESVEDSFNKAYEEFGRIDALICCVGEYGYKTLDQYDLEAMEHIVAVNEVGTYVVVKEIMKKMKKGSMVLISSTAAQIGSSDPVYAGSKAAILGFSKSMAKALAPDVRVNCVSPGVTESEMTKNMNQERIDQLIGMSLLKKIATPQTVANGIYFLASDQADHITGACLDINGGYVLR
jgi:3-oxoacyl-[acyl-carrier protein] reductase